MTVVKGMEMRRDVPFAGPTEYVTYREVWYIHARPAIRHLITSNNEELYLSACTLTIPWMDRCYTLCHFEYDKARHDPKSLIRKYCASDIVKFIFCHDLNEPPDYIEDMCGHLAEVFSSLKHDGYLRQGYTFNYRFDTLFTPLLFNSEVKQFAKIKQTSESSKEMQSRAVSPKAWVNQAVDRIDQLFLDARILDKRDDDEIEYPINM